MDNATALTTLIRNRPDDDDGRNPMFRDMLACFGAFNIRIVGSLTGGAILVENARHPHGDTFAVSDNGGEVNIRRINGAELTRSEPYTAWSMMLDGATVAYRVRRAMDGEPVDYDVDLKGELEALRDAPARCVQHPSA
ncbi:MAG: hypothetical protein EKK55_13525 [Rhodocyclaceae bacterium]|nr:MAG: hypothetical protein EKK55_13525 [Rhodocyclaceae bacterium]